LVTFAFYLVVAPEKLDANIIPRQIDYGREPDASISAEAQEFVIRLPLRIAGDFDRLKIRPESDSTDLDITQSAAYFSKTGLAASLPTGVTGNSATQPTLAAEGRAGVATIKFLLRWKRPPAIGEFNRRVSFVVSPDELGFKQFDVPLRGEAY
jgi:hypothetical protein